MSRYYNATNLLQPATVSRNGLMASTDKAKLDNIPEVQPIYLVITSWISNQSGNAIIFHGATASISQPISETLRITFQMGNGDTYGIVIYPGLLTGSAKSTNTNPGGTSKGEIRNSNYNSSEISVTIIKETAQVVITSTDQLPLELQE